MTLNDADAVYVGGDAVDRVYAGTELVWEAGPSYTWHDDFIGPLHERWTVAYGERQEPHLTGNVHVNTALPSPYFDLKFRFIHLEGQTGTVNSVVFGMDDASTPPLLVNIIIGGGVNMGLLDFGNPDAPEVDDPDTENVDTVFTLQARGDTFTLLADGDEVLHLHLDAPLAVDGMTAQARYDCTLEYVTYTDLTP